MNFQPPRPPGSLRFPSGLNRACDETPSHVVPKQRVQWGLMSKKQLRTEHAHAHTHAHRGDTSDTGGTDFALVRPPAPFFRQKGRRRVSTHGGAHSFDVSHIHTRTHHTRRYAIRRIRRSASSSSYLNGAVGPTPIRLGDRPVRTRRQHHTVGLRRSPGRRCGHRHGDAEVRLRRLRRRRGTRRGFRDRLRNATSVGARAW